MSNLTTTAIERNSDGTSTPPPSPAVVTPLDTQMVSHGTPDAERGVELHRELVRQFSPVGAVERLLVAELARCATKLEQFSTAADNLREVATALGQAVLREDGFGLTGNALLAAAVSSDAVEKADRASASHSRAFFRALRELLEMQDRRAAATLPAVPEQNHGFDSEEQCVEYLANWQCRQFRCQHCGAREARFLPAKRRIRCAACGRQMGLRAATAMADSALPLKIWFDAIQFLLVDPNLSAAELQRRLSIRRVATVRALARRVRAALTADDCTMLLAGLDQKLAEAASSAPSPKKTDERGGNVIPHGIKT